jgi:hypothetical protein
MGDLGIQERLMLKKVPDAVDCRFLATVYHQNKGHFGFKHNKNGKENIMIFL